jgi:hypothetical protein
MINPGLGLAFRKLTTGVRTALGGQSVPQAGSQTSKIKPTSDPYKNFETDLAKRESDITNAYGSMRAANLAQAASTKTQGMEMLKKKGAAIGGFGGAATKMEQLGAQEIDRGAAQDAANISAEESKSKQALGQEAQAVRTQASQFGQTLEFQKNSFLDQLKYNYEELEENKKTNLVNAMIALKDGGFFDKTFDEVANFFNSGMAAMYGNRVPRVPEAGSKYLYGGQSNY